MINKYLKSKSILSINYIFFNHYFVNASEEAFASIVVFTTALAYFPMFNIDASVNLVFGSRIFPELTPFSGSKLLKFGSI